MGKWLFNILVALDQLVNTIFLGDPDETISSRVGKRYNQAEWRWFGNFINCLFFWQKNHVLDSIEHDE